MCTLFLIIMKKSHSHLSKLIQSHRDETKHLLLKGGKNTAESYHHFMNFPVHCWSFMSTWKQYGCCLCFPKAHKKPGLNTAAQTATQTVATRVYLLCKSDSYNYTVRTLFAQASSSQEVSCSTRMISFISALIFSKVKLRFFKASSTPWLSEVLVVT